MTDQIRPITILNTTDKRANLNGCLPCPQCNSKDRYPTAADHQDHPQQILCQNCSFTEPYLWDEPNAS